MTKLSFLSFTLFIGLIIPSSISASDPSSTEQSQGETQGESKWTGEIEGTILSYIFGPHGMIIYTPAINGQFEFRILQNNSFTGSGDLIGQLDAWSRRFTTVQGTSETCEHPAGTFETKLTIFGEYMPEANTASIFFNSTPSWPVSVTCSYNILGGPRTFEPIFNPLVPTFWNSTLADGETYTSSNPGDYNRIGDNQYIPPSVIWNTRITIHGETKQQLYDYFP